MPAAVPWPLHSTLRAGEAADEAAEEGAEFPAVAGAAIVCAACQVSSQPFGLVARYWPSLFLDLEEFESC